jgi:hypothetical protein
MFVDHFQFRQFRYSFPLFFGSMEEICYPFYPSSLTYEGIIADRNLILCHLFPSLLREDMSSNSFAFNRLIGN